MKISTQRWKGRLDAAMAILTNRGIVIQQGSTYSNLRDAVDRSDAFSFEEKKAFDSLMVRGLSEND